MFLTLGFIRNPPTLHRGGEYSGERDNPQINMSQIRKNDQSPAPAIPHFIPDLRFLFSYLGYGIIVVTDSTCYVVKLLIVELFLLFVLFWFHNRNVLKIMIELIFWCKSRQKSRNRCIIGGKICLRLGKTINHPVIYCPCDL